MLDAGENLAFHHANARLGGCWTMTTMKRVWLSLQIYMEVETCTVTKPDKSIERLR